MAGYNYVMTKQGAASAKGESPVVFFQTFKRIAIEQFETKVMNAKKAGAKLGDTEWYELVPYETSGNDRDVMAKASGKDKNGHDVVFFLERFHVGGQAAERGLNMGGGRRRR